MNGAQITMAVLVVINLRIDSAMDGEPKTGKHQFSVSLVGTLISQAILYWGGFWS